MSVWIENILVGIGDTAESPNEKFERCLQLLKYVHDPVTGIWRVGQYTFEMKVDEFSWTTPVVIGCISPRKLDTSTRDGMHNFITVLREISQPFSYCYNNIVYEGNLLPPDYPIENLRALLDRRVPKVAWDRIVVQLVNYDVISMTKTEIKITKSLHGPLNLI